MFHATINRPYHLAVWTLMLWVGGIAHAQHNLPPFVNFLNDTTNTLTWHDNQGQHLLLLEQSDQVMDEDEATTTQTVHATHWLLHDSQRQQLWHIEDGIYDCPVDVEAKFLAAPRFTDLNNDGILEIWLIVQKACKGDISPAEVEVILMDQDAVPYRLVAEELLVFPDGTTDGGTYDLSDLHQLPEAYQTYAVEYLLKNYTFEHP